jgi:hypothetical protein
MATPFQLAFDARGRDALSRITPVTNDDERHYNHALYLAMALVRARDLPTTPANVRKASELVDSYYGDVNRPVGAGSTLCKKLVELERELLTIPFFRVHRACPLNILDAHGRFVARDLSLASQADPYYAELQAVLKTPRTL